MRGGDVFRRHAATAALVTALGAGLGAAALPAAAQDGSPSVADAVAAYEAGSYETAHRALRPLAEAGEPQAQYMLGRLYDNGQHVAQDFAEAARWTTWRR